MASSVMRGACLAFVFAAIGCRGVEQSPTLDETPLPAARTESSVSLETAFARRKPARIFAAAEVSATELGQLLWATRATPAMGAIPLDVYVATAAGVFRYSPTTHAVVSIVANDVRKAIAQASGEPEDVRDAPILFVFVAQPAAGRAKYGERAERFAALEAGHSAQNVLLQATALNLSATPLALFHEDAIREALLLPREHAPLHLVAVGRSL